MIEKSMLIVSKFEKINALIEASYYTYPSRKLSRMVVVTAGIIRLFSHLKQSYVTGAVFRLKSIK